MTATFLKLICLIFILSLSGCFAKSGVGNSDYARVSPLRNDIQTAAFRDSVPAADRAGCRLFERKFTHADAIHAKGIIKKGDAFSIWLNQAYLREVAEIYGGAEIAIVANIYERLKNDYDATNTVKGASAALKGRLVYFSSGVRAKAMLNMANLPVYGPAEYKGGDLVMQLYVIELDGTESSLQVGNLLGTLAQLGAATNPAVSPLAPILNELGSALLDKVSEDDLQLQYDTVLRGPTPTQPMEGADAPLLYGDYIVLRRQGGQELYSFDDFMYWEKNASIYMRRYDKDKKTTEGKCGGELFNGSTWLTMSIRKDAAPLKLAASKSYADLLSVLSDPDENLTSTLPNKIDGFLMSISDSLGQKISAILNEAMLTKEPLTSGLSEQLDDAVALIAKSINSNSEKTGTLSADQIEASIERINALATKNKNISPSLTKANFCKQVRNGQLSQKLKISTSSGKSKAQCNQ